MSTDAPDPADQERAIGMVVERQGDGVEVRLTGNSPVDQRVSYELLLSGASTSRHRGETALRAHQETILSTMRMGAASGWCVSAKIVEENGLAYEYSEGDCD